MSVIHSNCVVSVRMFFINIIGMLVFVVDVILVMLLVVVMFFFVIIISVLLIAIFCLSLFL